MEDTGSLEGKYTTRRECELQVGVVKEVKATFDEMQKDVGEIKESLSSIATWMDLHGQTHTAVPGGWKKAQTYAVIASVVVASMSLLTSTVLGIMSIIHITGKP